jgi:hypothetical protein
MDAVIVHYRDDDGMVGRMRVAVIGRVVKEGVSALHVWMPLFQLARHDVRSDKNVGGKTLRFGYEFVIGGENAARKVTRCID